MAIEIEKGRIKKYRVTCKSCKSKLKFRKHDVVTNLNTGKYYLITECPCCGKLVFLSKDWEKTEFIEEIT